MTPLMTNETFLPMKRFADAAMSIVADEVNPAIRW